jgi:hypothetical protein
LVMISILSLVVAYVVVALRYWRVAPVLSALGLVFGAAFVGFEITGRSFEIFVVGQRWAPAFQASTDSMERAAILRRFVLWNESIRGWHFPQLVAHLLAAVCFGVATLRDTDSWRRLATLAFFLNALRLLGRLLGTYGGQAWLAGLNDRYYFPAVGAINLMLVIWLFHLVKMESAEPAGRQGSSIGSSG